VRHLEWIAEQADHPVVGHAQPFERLDDLEAQPARVQLVVVVDRRSAEHEPDPAVR
jgi:hypothetical protein